jgi:hypothetical protein
MMKLWNKNKKNSEEYREGDEVLVLVERLSSNRQSQKLDDKWQGPFQILGKKGPLAYELDLPASWKGYRVFNEGRLKRYHCPKFREQEQAPVRPDLEFTEEGGKEYEVKEILGKREVGRKTEYLV